jgi:hypothetical protein
VFLHVVDRFKAMKLIIRVTAFNSFNAEMLFCCCTRRLRCAAAAAAVAIAAHLDADTERLFAVAVIASY